MENLVLTGFSRMLAHEFLAFAVPDRHFSILQRLATIKPQFPECRWSVPRYLVFRVLLFRRVTRGLFTRLSAATGCGHLGTSASRPTSSSALDSIIPSSPDVEDAPLPIHHTILEA